MEKENSEIDVKSDEFTLIVNGQVRCWWNRIDEIEGWIFLSIKWKSKRMSLKLKNDALH